MAAKPARAARFTLDAPEYSGTIPGAIGDILPPGVALTSNLAVILSHRKPFWFGTARLIAEWIKNGAQRVVTESDFEPGYIQLYCDGAGPPAGRRTRGACIRTPPPRTQPPPEDAPLRSLSRIFMRRVLTYERQCRTHGGLSATTRRALAAMVNGTPEHSSPAGSVSAGTHLVREWNGRTYQVEVIDSGYRFDGKPIRPSPPSQSESPAPTGQDHAFSV